MTCRDRNRIALQNDLVGAATLGISNLLVLTGDNPKAGDQPDAKPVFDLEFAPDATAVSIRDKGELPTGREITDPPQLFIGASRYCRSTHRPAGKHKAAQGQGRRRRAASSKLSCCSTLGSCAAMRLRSATLGLTERLYILIGIGPGCPRPSRRAGCAKIF